VKRLVPAAICVALASVLVACRGDGRNLRAPKQNQDLSIVTTTTVADALTTGSDPVASPGTPVFTAEWRLGGAMPIDSTCRGAGQSPALTWTDVPSDVSEIAISAIDLDAQNTVHWIVAGLSPATSGIARNLLPEGAIVTRNGLGTTGYGAPCPTSGTHRVLFTLYFLQGRSGILSSMDAATAMSTLDLAAGQRVTLVGTVTV
jgi:Raf kinase inhibitor-like YbhB/YbcL family protein